MFRIVAQIITFPARLLGKLARFGLGFVGATLARKATRKVYKRVTGSPPPKPEDGARLTTGKALAYAAGAGALAGVGRMALRSLTTKDDAES